MMKSLLLTTLALTATLTSCSVKVNEGSSTKYRNSIVLGKFNDIVTESTLNEDELKDLPRLIDLKKDMTSAKNQGSRGTCTFFSTAALIEATIKKDQNIDVNISEEYLNYVTKSMGHYSNNEGSVVRSNIIATDKKGILLERDYSYQPSWFDKALPCEKYKSSDVSAPRECFNHGKPANEILEKVISAEKINFEGALKNTNDIIRFLAEEKRPLTLSVPVNFNGWPDSGDVVHNEELRQECLKSSDACGGHSVLLTGYDLDKKIFFFKNSWGKNWGQEGFGTMSFETLDLYAGTDLYFAKLEEKLAIPENYNEDNLKLISLKAKGERIEDTLKINVEASVANASGRTLYVSSFLAKKQEGTVADASDANTSLIPQSAAETATTSESYIRAIKYILNPDNDLALESESALNLSFLPGSEATVKKVLDSESETLLRNTIYVHTDSDTWVVLKREFQTVTK